MTSAKTSPSFLKTIVISLSYPLFGTSTHVPTPEPELLDFQPKDERKQMSIDAQMTMREYAGHRWPTLNHKGRMARLAGVLAMGHRRVRAIYQNEESVRLRADESAKIAALKREEANDAVGAGQAEYRALEARLAQVEALLQTVHAEFYGPYVDAYRASAAGPVGAIGSAGASAASGGAGDGPDDLFDFSD